LRVLGDRSARKRAGLPPTGRRTAGLGATQSVFENPAARPTVPPLPPAIIETDLLTVEDYRATPDGTRYRLVEGELYLMAPAPDLFHQSIAGNIFPLLSRHLEKKPHPGKVFIAPCDVYLDDNNVVQPDVFFVSNARAKLLADDGIRGAPDLVIEVLSPATARLDKTTKRRVYARTGVREMWLVDPILLQIHLNDYARDPKKAVRILEDDETFETAVLPGLAVAAAEVFKR